MSLRTYRSGFAFLLLSVFLLLSTAVCSAQAAAADAGITQFSLLSALMQGRYEGTVTCGELKSYGNVGIGTFEALDGEMVILDGGVYQVRADGRVVKAPDATLSPFAVVTRLQPGTGTQLSPVATLGELQQLLEAMIVNRNLPQVIRLDGVFRHVKTRSVFPQEKPYPPLAAATAQQAVFDYYDVKGTLVGFWCPDYFQGLNVPGFHLHFISEDRSMGGHVLDCALDGGTVQVASRTEFQLHLPGDAAFGSLKLAGDWHAETKKVEQ